MIRGLSSALSTYCHRTIRESWLIATLRVSIHQILFFFSIYPRWQSYRGLSFCLLSSSTRQGHSRTRMCQMTKATISKTRLVSKNEAYTSDDYQEDKKVLNGAIHDLNVGHKTIEEFQPQPSTSNGVNGLGIAVISTNQLSSQPSAFNPNFDNSRL